MCPSYSYIIFSKTEKRIKNTKLTKTIIAPVLILYKYDRYIPIKKDNTLITPELTTTLLKDLKILMDVNAGKIITLLY